MVSLGGVYQRDRLSRQIDFPWQTGHHRRDFLWYSGLVRTGGSTDGAGATSEGNGFRLVAPLCALPSIKRCICPGSGERSTMGTELVSAPSGAVVAGSASTPPTSQSA